MKTGVTKLILITSLLLTVNCANTLKNVSTLSSLGEDKLLIGTIKICHNGSEVDLSKCGMINRYIICTMWLTKSGSKQESTICVDVTKDGRIAVPLSVGTYEIPLIAVNICGVIGDTKKPEQVPQFQIDNSAQVFNVGELKINYVQSTGSMIGEGVVQGITGISGVGKKTITITSQGNYGTVANDIRHFCPDLPGSFSTLNISYTK
jgi:hypothetical protein